MRRTGQARIARVGVLTAAVLSAAFLSACTSSSQTKSMAKQKRSKEYFAESVYGVKASPRVSNMRSNLPRGGGRDQLGKPYKVRGKWYYPKEDAGYRKVGGASWYGDAFHGRLTANGEIYDMTHLTAAHPTMPLPSYARVTNTANGHSVIVRVNDRGPYHPGRIIDLSRRAAELLDYTRAGTAKVEVEYVGRAPLDGHDDQYLMASYRPGSRVPDPTMDGLPSDVMIAMNGATPSGGRGRAETLPGVISGNPGPTAVGFGGSGFDLPSSGPVAPERPAMDVETAIAFGALSYAPAEKSPSRSAFARFDAGAAGTPARPSAQGFVAAATFGSADEAAALAETLSRFGRAWVERSEGEGGAAFSVLLAADGRLAGDALLRAAWTHGAPDAIAVRD